MSSGADFGKNFHTEGLAAEGSHEYMRVHHPFTAFLRIARALLVCVNIFLSTTDLWFVLKDHFAPDTCDADCDFQACAGPSLLQEAN